MDPTPDPGLVQRLSDLHIEDPAIVAAILAKHGLTVCDVDPEHDEPTD